MSYVGYSCLSACCVFVLVCFLFATFSDLHLSKQESFSEPPPRYQSPSIRSTNVDISQQLYLPGRILQVEEREAIDSA